MKIELPLKANPHSSHRRMAGNPMLRSRVIERHKKVVNGSKLKLVLKDSLGDATGEIKIYEDEYSASSSLIALSTIDDSNLEGVINFFTDKISKHYKKAKNSSITIIK